MELERTKEILTTFTDEFQNALVNRAKELGFDLNRGEISFNESLANLSHARDILLDAIIKDKLNQLPLSIQKVFLSNLESIQAFTQNLVAGNDEIVNINTHIENLYANIWKFGLHSISNELLSYITKMNNIKNLSLKLRELQNELEKGLDLKQNVEQLIDRIKAYETEIVEKNTSANNYLQEIKVLNEQTVNNTNQSAALLANIQVIDTNVNSLLASSKTNSSEINALTEKIKEFYASIDNYKSTIDTVSTDAKTALENNNTKTEELINSLISLEVQIKTQLQKATGISLFHSFNTRQEMLKKGKNIWILAIIGLLAATLLLTATLAITTKDWDIAFFLKLSMSIPLIYAITFCTIQYSKERKLEEEYAFKSNISLSLIPYKDLIEKLIEDQPGERTKYNDFIISSINKIFTSPTDALYDNETTKGNNPDNAMKQLGKAIEVIVKPLEPLLHLLKK